MGTIKISDTTLNEVEELTSPINETLDETVELLIKEALERRRDRHALRQRLEAIARMTPDGVIQSDSTVLLREDRDR
jgi:hypothetical protein